MPTGVKETLNKFWKKQNCQKISIVTLFLRKNYAQRKTPQQSHAINNSQGIRVSSHCDSSSFSPFLSRFSLIHVVAMDFFWKT